MPCIRHNYQKVSNPYKNGKLSPDSFVGVDWVVERVCSECGQLAPKQNV